MAESKLLRIEPSSSTTIRNLKYLTQKLVVLRAGLAAGLLWRRILFFDRRLFSARIIGLSVVVPTLGCPLGRLLVFGWTVCINLLGSAGLRFLTLVVLTYGSRLLDVDFLSTTGGRLLGFTGPEYDDLQD